MIAKLGVLMVALAGVYLVSRILRGEGRRVEKTLSRAARGRQHEGTLEKDPETGIYRARDDRRSDA